MTNYFVIGRGPRKVRVSVRWLISKDTPAVQEVLLDELMQRFAGAAMAVLKNKSRVLESAEIKRKIAENGGRRPLIEEPFAKLVETNRPNTLHNGGTP
jgi:hypothetical protein